MYHNSSDIVRESTSAFDINENIFDFDLDDLYEKLMCFNTILYNSTSKSSNFMHNSKRITFPQMLHELLQQNNHPEIISWLSDGRSFKIYKKKDFENDLLSTKFGGIKFRSFQRQLNIYGFLRLGNGVKSFTYRHRLFVKDKSKALRGIKRIPIKGKANLPESILQTISSEEDLI